MNLIKLLDTNLYTETAVFLYTNNELLESELRETTLSVEFIKKNKLPEIKDPHSENLRY